MSTHVALSGCLLALATCLPAAAPPPVGPEPLPAGLPFKGQKFEDLGSLGIHAESVFAADCNGDGKEDLVVGTLFRDPKDAGPTWGNDGAIYGVRVYLSDGKRLIHAKAWDDDTRKGHLQAVGDIDGDHKPDLIVDGTIYKNTGSGFKKSSLTVTVPIDVLTVGIGDVDGDGAADIAVVTAEGKAVISTNAPKGGAWTTTERVLWKTPYPPFAAWCSSTWTKGKLLSVLAWRLEGPVRYPLNDKDGAATDAKALIGQEYAPFFGKYYPLDIEEWVPAVLDINGDGTMDILLSNARHQSGLLLNRGGGNFSFQTTVNGFDLNYPRDGRPAWLSASDRRAVGIDLAGDKFGDVLFVTADDIMYLRSNAPFTLK